MTSWDGAGVPLVGFLHTLRFLPSGVLLSRVAARGARISSIGGAASVVDAGWASLTIPRVVMLCCALWEEVGGGSKLSLGLAFVSSVNGMGILSTLLFWLGGFARAQLIARCAPGDSTRGPLKKAGSQDFFRFVQVSHLPYLLTFIVCFCFRTLHWDEWFGDGGRRVHGHICCFCLSALC